MTHVWPTPASVRRSMGRWREPALAVALCVLAGCATAPPTQAGIDARRRAEFDRSMERWHGAEVRELVAKLGPPTTKSKAADGAWIYEYVRSTRVNGPIGPVPFRCVVRYTVDARSAIITGHRIEAC